jgi:hypothetical protein
MAHLCAQKKSQMQTTEWVADGLSAGQPNAQRLVADAIAEWPQRNVPVALRGVVGKRLTYKTVGGVHA